MIHLVVLEDHHQRKEMRIVQRHRSYIDASECARHICEDYIRTRVGHDCPIFEYEFGAKQRHFGFFIQRSRIASKLSVYRKYVESGYITNTTICQKLFSVFVVTCVESDRQPSAEIAQWSSWRETVAFETHAKKLAPVLDIVVQTAKSKIGTDIPAAIPDDSSESSDELPEE